jgi:ricin-type beta-trefoil lectin protein
MATTYQGPFLIQFVGTPLSDVCLQAAYPGADAIVSIAPIDASGNTTLQQWFFGSDQRLYLNTGSMQFCLDYVNPAENGAPLIIADANLSDQTQMWGWNGGQQNASTFNNVGSPGFSIDDNGGGIAPGNQVQLWDTDNGNPNQAYTMSVIPAFAGR